MSTHWNGTIAHASRVASSAVQYGTLAPIASTIFSYSINARAATAMATASSAMELRNQIKPSATTPSTTPLRTRVMRTYFTPATTGAAMPPKRRSRFWYASTPSSR